MVDDKLLQPVDLALLEADGFDHFPGESPVIDLQARGEHVLDAEPLDQRLHHELRRARYYCHHVTVELHLLSVLS